MKGNIFLMILLSCSLVFTQDLYFGMKTADFNKNGFEKRLVDPISVIYIKNDTTFYIFHQWYKEETISFFPSYYFRTELAFTPELQTMLASAGKLNIFCDSLILNDTIWHCKYKLNSNLDSTYICNNSTTYKGYKYFKYQKIFTNANDSHSIKSKFNSFENYLFINKHYRFQKNYDSLLKYYEKKIIDHDKGIYYKENRSYGDSNCLRFDFYKENYLITNICTDDILSEGNYKIIDEYIILNDSFYGRDFYLKIFPNNTLDILCIHPIIDILHKDNHNHEDLFKILPPK